MTTSVPSEEPNALVAIGFCLRAHGLGGEMRVKTFNEDSDLLSQVEAVTLRTKDGRDVPAKLLAARRAGDGWLVTFDGVRDRTGAEAIRGAEILVPRAAFPELEEDEVYLVDLVGLEVFEGERKVGVVDGFFEYPSVDCLRVVCDDGVREIPMLDEFVEGIDEERGIVFVTRVDEIPVEAKRESPKR